MFLAHPVSRAQLLSMHGTLGSWFYDEGRVVLVFFKMGAWLRARDEGWRGAKGDGRSGQSRAAIVETRAASPPGELQCVGQSALYAENEAVQVSSRALQELHIAGRHVAA